jgi:hypothetical protein
MRTLVCGRGTHVQDETEMITCLNTGTQNTHKHTYLHLCTDALTNRRIDCASRHSSPDRFSAAACRTLRRLVARLRYSSDKEAPAPDCTACAAMECPRSGCGVAVEGLWRGCGVAAEPRAHAWTRYSLEKKPNPATPGFTNASQPRASGLTPSSLSFAVGGDQRASSPPQTAPAGSWLVSARLN